MKKLFIGLLLSTVTFNSFSAVLEDENRFFLYGSKDHWLFLNGYVSNPPYASIWTGMNVDGKKYSSDRMLITFNCKLRKYRSEAIVEYSLPDNKGSVLFKSYEPTPWRPVEPDGYFNFVYEIACDKELTATHPN